MPAKDLPGTGTTVIQDDLYINLVQVLKILEPELDWQFILEIVDQDGFPILVFQDNSTEPNSKCLKNFNIKIKGPGHYEMWSC